MRTFRLASRAAHRALSSRLRCGSAAFLASQLEILRYPSAYRKSVGLKYAVCRGRSTRRENAGAGHLASNKVRLHNQSVARPDVDASVCRSRLPPARCRIDLHLIGLDDRTVRRPDHDREYHSLDAIGGNQRGVCSGIPAAEPTTIKTNHRAKASQGGAERAINV